ncbi:MAG: ParB N-terminal domain-containing protein [Nitrososphaerota archaeon]|jgi:hypothetical protein|nr:ParB N-terminal domain-containing protein [Nitrososphaerota archaeon]
MQTQVKVINLADIDRDVEIYPRQNVQRARVTELAEYVSNGIKLDPIVVCQIRGRSNYVLVDGAHRSEVYLSKGIKKVEVEDLGLLTKLQAAKESIERNTHGPLPLSRSDRELAAKKLQKLGATESEIHALTSLDISIIRSLDDVTYKGQNEEKRLPRYLTPIRGGKPMMAISQSEAKEHEKVLDTIPRDFHPKATMRHLNTLLEYDWLRMDDPETLRLARKLYEKLKPLFAEENTQRQDAK